MESNIDAILEVLDLSDCELGSSQRDLVVDAVRTALQEMLN